MNKCIEKDNLLLFLANDLSANAKARFEEHLKNCGQCKAELEAIKADESLLKAAVNGLFKKHRSKPHILKAVKNVKVVQTRAKSRVLFGFLRPWAFAFAVIAAVALVSAMLFFRPSERVIKGLSVQAASLSCLVNGQAVKNGTEMHVLLGEKMLLKGAFLIKLKGGEVIELNAKEPGTIFLTNNVLSLSCQSLELKLVKGAECELCLNNKPLKLVHGKAFKQGVGALTAEFECKEPKAEKLKNEVCEKNKKISSEKPTNEPKDAIIIISTGTPAIKAPKPEAAPQNAQTGGSAPISLGEGSRPAVSNPFSAESVTLSN